jgi:glucosyl-dolichyl phosphate glucuronosyltransferase
MDASVVVCTRNRAPLLEITLDSLAAQTLDVNRFEVVVIDNVSTDSTPEVVERWQSANARPCRRVVEERRGTNHARNRGVREARGRVVAFLDDDARAEHDWLERLLQTFEEERVAGVGGAIRLAWQSPPPRWLTEDYLLGLLAEFELGDVRCRVERFPYLVGTNMAFAADVFERVGGFSAELERRSATVIGMEDLEFCHRVVRSGGTLAYEPRAVVHHFVPDDRATFRFLVRRSYADGRSMARFHRLSGLRDSASRPRRFFRQLTALPVRMLRRDWARSALAVAFMARHLGYMRESAFSSPPAQDDRGAFASRS